MQEGLQAMASGLSQRVPLQQLGLAGLMPSQQNPRGGMPAGVDPMASAFKSAEDLLEDLASQLQSEGSARCLRQANEMKAMAVKINRMAIEHSQEYAAGPSGSPAGGSPGANPTPFPNVNAGGMV